MSTKSEQHAESVAALKCVLGVIENVIDDPWATDGQELLVLRNALDEIHEIVTLTLLNDGRDGG